MFCVTMVSKEQTEAFFSPTGLHNIEWLEQVEPTENGYSKEDIIEELLSEPRADKDKPVQDAKGVVVKFNE